MYRNILMNKCIDYPAYQVAARRNRAGTARARSGELFKQFQDNEGFRRWLADTMFGLTYEDDAA